MKNEFYAVKNKNDDIRRVSSSGGVFNALASYVIDNDGVVYGAAYNEECNVYHKRVDKKEDIIDLHGSKYVLSDVSSAYNKVKEDLENNKKVLFSGTPCQIAALKSILRDTNTDNLFLVDVVCHGTPTQNYYDDYKKYLENKYNSRIKKINMRYKDKKTFNKNKKTPYIRESKIEPHVMFAEFENGKKYSMKSGFEPYFEIMDYFIKKSCFKCPYANMNRVSDITIGDFHEISSSLGDFNDGNGVSLLIVNTPKGKEMFNKVIENFEYFEKNIDECLQPALEKPAVIPKNYEEFTKDYEVHGFSYVLKKYTNNSIKFKIKKVLYIIGLWDILKKIKRG